MGVFSDTSGGAREPKAKAKGTARTTQRQYGRLWGNGDCGRTKSAPLTAKGAPPTFHGYGKIEIPPFLQTRKSGHLKKTRA